MNALGIMGLKLPLTPDELKRQYRELAKKWHPDRNLNNRNADKQMKELNRAVEILTGIDSNEFYSLTSTKTGTTFKKELSRSEYTVEGISIEKVISEVSVANWIYASSFAGHNNTVYLAAYSGKIIQLNQEGHPIRVYDIGTAPNRIIDTGEYLYFLTNTRLYVLREDTLVALIDVFGSGELIIAKTGFGLLQKKYFQWFNKNGKRVGTIVTKNPIRRVYYSAQGMIIETRQRRATICGVKTWWE